MASLHLDKVLAHATRTLAHKGHDKPADRLSLYRKFLKIEEHRLRLKHAAEGGGREICQGRAQLVDVIVRNIFESATRYALAVGKHKERPVALCAIGGYGRGELNPFSDVDIMFLHNGQGGEVPAFVGDVVSQILYLLWDVGFKVGHSTRSLGAAIRLANEDMLSKTSLLEARCVAGDRELFQKFKSEFEAKCVRAPGKSRQYILWRQRNQAERHAKLGSTVFLQEPNIKNGCGGLRDYQNLMWVAHFQTGASSTRRLVEMRLMSETERRDLKAAYDFLLRVRTELHYLNKRATDVLTLFYQGQIANKFNYPQKNVLARSEAFMRDYFRHARNIYLITRSVSERLSLPTAVAEKPAPVFFRFLPQHTRREEFDGFYSKDGQIYFQSRDVFNEDPMRLMRVFQHAQQRNLELSAELRQLIRRRGRLVNRAFQYSKQARETFLAILSRKGQVGRILRAMHEVDFLGRYLPEFGELTCLVQHEFFHRYTADEHTLVCIEALDAMIDTEDSRAARYRRLFQELEDPATLYLALLLHDVGKAVAGRGSHSEVSAMLAAKVCRRLQLSSLRRQQVVLLVDNHVLLSITAQTRNLEDAATISSFASIVRNRHNLEALLLLTRADALGTAAHVWSDWKETLALQLYDATVRYLERGAFESRSRQEIRAEAEAYARKKLPKDYQDEISAHISGMPDRYFAIYEPEAVVRHIKLFRQFLIKRMEDSEAGLGAVLSWEPRPDQGHTEVCVVTWDRRELFQRLAGAFAVAQVNILSADIYTRNDSLVLDIFRVCNTSHEAVTNNRTVAQIEEHVEQALINPEFDFASRIEKARACLRSEKLPELDFPTRIAVLNDASPDHTVVEVRSPDRLGLLYELLGGFQEADVNIDLSRISTEKGAAIDSFYVTDAKGAKINGDAAIRRLQAALKKAAQPPSQAPLG